LTLFSSCLRIKKELNINCALLREVLSWWVPTREFIQVRQQLVKLNCLDVSICLGLSGGGNDVVFYSELCGEVGLLFPLREIKVSDIIDRMRDFVGEVDNVQNVCRLYGLVCFAVLFFPMMSRTLTNLPFRLLDNLDTMRKYRWASYVHSFLISSLNRSSTVYKEKSNEHTIFVSGSVAVV